MALLRDDPDARAAVLNALAAVGAARTGYAGPEPDAEDPELSEFAAEVADIEIEDGDPRLTRFALAEVAAIALDELDAAGGDSAVLVQRIWSAVTGGETRNRS